MFLLSHQHSSLCDAFLRDWDHDGRCVGSRFAAMHPKIFAQKYCWVRRCLKLNLGALSRRLCLWRLIKGRALRDVIRTLRKTMPRGHQKLSLPVHLALLNVNSQSNAVQTVSAESESVQRRISSQNQHKQLAFSPSTNDLRTFPSCLSLSAVMTPSSVTSLWHFSQRCWP